VTLFDLIAFDADDTLWHTERLYVAAQTRLERLLLERYGLDGVEQALYRIEMRNMPLYGFGIKAFGLSMVETAVMLTDGRIRGHEIGQIVKWVHEMLAADVELLDYVAETVAELARSHILMLATKGDLHDQERKLARSGIAHHFRHVEVLADKTVERYQALLDRYEVTPARFLMVGNSLRSDVLPVLALGGQAVYVPAEVTWAHEVVDTPGPKEGRYHQLEHIGELPALIDRLARKTQGRP
jgi:putative hydrolase of the HAD superfamily